MSARIADDPDMAKTFIATFNLDGPYREIVQPDDSMYSVLSTWGQFPYTLPPTTASNLWKEFMTAYRRKRRPLTHNPVSLIGKDPYIVASRLEREEF